MLDALRFIRELLARGPEVVCTEIADREELARRIDRDRPGRLELVTDGLFAAGAGGQAEFVEAAGFDDVHLDQLTVVVTE